MRGNQIRFAASEKPLQRGFVDFEGWWHNFNPTLLAIARKYSHTDDQAQDLIQDLAVQALGKISKFKDELHFTHWARIRLHGLVVDRYRAVKRRPPIDSYEDFLAPPTPAIQEARMGAKMILSLVDGLPNRQREVVRQTIEGRDTDEIAKNLSIKPATVRSLLRFGRSQLAEKLEQLDKGGKR